MPSSVSTSRCPCSSVPNRIPIISSWFPPLKLTTHQANSRIIESAREKLGLSADKVVNEVAKRGNTSAGSIPLLLDELNRAGKLKTGMKVGLVAFGGGLTSAGAIIEWTK